MTTQQSGNESVAAWEYRRAFMRLDELVSGDLTGDLLLRSIQSVKAGSSREWRIVRLKISADDRGRAWLDLLLKRPAEANLSATAPADETPAESLPMRRAA